MQIKAREAGLWNLFLPAVSGLTQLDYAYIAEETGRCVFAPEVFNCQAPGKISTSKTFDNITDQFCPLLCSTRMDLLFVYRS